MAVEDHGLEALKKSAEEIVPGQKNDMLLKVGFPTGGRDAFERIRVSNPFGVWDNKNIFDENPNFWDTDLSGGGAINHLINKSAVEYAVGTVSGDKAVRQTIRYFSHVPGKSQSITIMVIMSASKVGLRQRIGLFDVNDGMFFQDLSGDKSVVIRSKVSGSVVDTVIPQSDWNIDKLDGTGLSKLDLAIQNAQIFCVDFQSAPGGFIRYNFWFNGKMVPFHQQNHSNLTAISFMSTPSLPLRIELENVATTASVSTLEEYPTSIHSDGGYQVPGLQFAESNGTTKRAVTTRLPLLALRLKTAFNTKPNRRQAMALFTRAIADSNDALIEVAHLHNPSGLVGGAWADVGGGSAMEVNFGLTAAVGNPEHVFDCYFVPAGTGPASETRAIDNAFRSRHSFISQNIASDNSGIFVLFATSFAAQASNVSGVIGALEFD